MSCAPPWMTEDRGLWCPGLVNMTSRSAPTTRVYYSQVNVSFRQRQSVDYFLASVLNDKADKSECLPSCKLIREVQIVCVIPFKLMLQLSDL